MCFMTVVFLFPTTRATDVPDMNYTVVVLGGILLLSVAWYYCPKYGGVHWFTGPVPTVEGYAERTPGEKRPDGEGSSVSEKKGASTRDSVVPADD